MTTPQTSLTPSPEASEPLFQRAPSTDEEFARNKPVELLPERVQELDEAAWYEQVYRGNDAAQLTVRAVVMGAGLGFLLSFTNLYIGLKTGWHLGVAITACILSFTVWGSFVRARIAKTPMTILENTCMQSTASAAGYATGGTMVSAIPALLMLSVSAQNPGGKQLPWPVLMAWTFFLGLLGTVLAIPMKRNMINQERLRFPSGMASAVTLRSLYSEGQAAIGKGRALLSAAVVAGILPVLKDLEILKGNERPTLIAGASAIFDWLPKMHIKGTTYALSAWHMKLDHGVALVAAGALVGLRATLSMMLGALTLIFVVGPAAIEWQWKNPLGQMVGAATKPGTAWKEIGLWVGAPMLVAAGLAAFAMQWRTIVRAFQGFGKGSGGPYRAAAGEKQGPEGVEVPMRWFFVGTAVAATGIIVIAWRFFEVPPHLGVVAVLLTFVLALVACRATGETDITPTGAMGKIMQLIYGGLIPQRATPNLMTAGITAGAASASADLLTDLKSGYLLGANPRRQFVAQALGIIPGTIATIIGWYILVPDASMLTGDTPPFPAPAAQQWKAVAELFTLGIENLHPMSRYAIGVGLVVGTALSLLEKALPKYKKYLPSATGIGLGFILPFYSPFAMFLGAAIAALVQSRKGKAADLVIPVASGLIAGESIVGVVVAALNNFVL